MLLVNMGMQEKKKTAVLKALEWLISSLTTIALGAIPQDCVTSSVSPWLFKK